MKAEQAIAAIENASSHDVLEQTLQAIIGLYGFSSYCFIDIGRAHVDVPFYVGTTGEKWEREYSSNSFIHVDECIRLARRTNRPFRWADVAMPARTGKRKPRALELMEAANDHGFRECLDIPFHYADASGRIHSSICALMWQDNARDFYAVESTASHELHLIAIYWMQRSIELRDAERRGTIPFPVSQSHGGPVAVRMTDKEREVIAWAARGKTADDTAEIMLISPETVRWHTKNAIEKLSAGNKTHAVAKAIHLGLVDL